MLCEDTVTALSREHHITVLTSGRGRGTTGSPAVDEGPVVRRSLPYLSYSRTDSFLAPASAVRGAREMRATLDVARPDLVLVFNAAQIPHSALWVVHERGLRMAMYVCAPWLDGLYSRDRFARHLSERGTWARAPWTAAMRAVNRLPGLRIDTGLPLTASVAWASHATMQQSPPPSFMSVNVSTVIYPATRRHARFSRATRRPERELLIAFVGRLEPQKGPDVAIRAFARFVRDGGFPQARFELAGSGQPAYVKTLLQLAAALGVADRVVFRGQLELEQVVDLFERAHLLVAPSTWEEPSGGVILEAACASLPVVASLSGGMPEVLRPGTEALYFPIGDWEACADAWAAALADPVATTERAAHARARADALSFENYLNDMEAFIHAAATV